MLISGNVRTVNKYQGNQRNIGDMGGRKGVDTLKIQSVGILADIFVLD